MKRIQHTRERTRERARDKRNAAASFTVEASLLMGIILFTLVSLIYAGFYLHDAASAQAAVCGLCASGANHSLESGGAGTLETVRRGMEKNGWTGAGQRALTVQAGEDAVTASFSGSMQVPGAALFLKGGTLSIGKTWTHRIIRPGKLIRRGRGLKALAKGREP